MNVWIDIGNTRIKLATGQPGALDELGSVAWRDPGCTGHLRFLLSQVADVVAVVSNVAGDKPLSQLTRALTGLGHAPPIQLGNPHDLLGLRCGYSSRAQLGVDRWFAMLGAWRACGTALCVVDLGTAGTADVVDANGLHHGGCIFAGAESQRRALAAGTANLSVPDRVSTTVFRDNTQDAIAAGTAFAVAAAVDRLFDEAEAVVGAPIQRYLTGGGAVEIRPYLKQPVHSAPQLVLDGIAAAWTESQR